MSSRPASPTPSVVPSPTSSTSTSASASASTTATMVVDDAEADKVLGVSGMSEPGEARGYDSGTKPSKTSKSKTSNVNTEKSAAGEDNENDTLAPLGRPISRGSVLQRMASRATQASRRSGRSARSGMSAAEATAMEMLLRTQTRESGVLAHAGRVGEKGHADGDAGTGHGHTCGHGSDESDTKSEGDKHIGGHGHGVLEKTMVVDLGNGPEEVCVVEWVDGDPDHPVNWPAPRKWLITFCVCYLTALTAVNATSVGVIAEWGMPWFDTDAEGFTMGLFVYLFAVAWTPLVLAPMSEVFGRSWIYHITSIINALLFIPQALSHNYSGYLAARWFQGMSSSVGNSMVGGTVADLFGANDRGPAMTFFAVSIFVGQALGGAIFGWVGQELGIQWCYGIMGIAAGTSVLLNIVVLKETRADVLLRRRAAKLTKITGKKHISPDAVNRKSWRDMLSTSAIRPLQYLFTEPIVSAISLWIGFAWGCIFLGTSSTLLVFRQYGWSSGMTGMSELTLLVGAILGTLSNMHNERLYRRAVAKSPTGRAQPEVRMYWAASAGLLFPLALFVYAWTGNPGVHWIVPAIFLSLSNWGVFIMYSSVFNYLADAYEIYSSSAQASQSFVRNIFSALFPLFSRKMYTNMGYAHASTTVAAIATALAAAPILIVVYGARLRAKSKVASAIWGAESAAGGTI